MLVFSTLSSDEDPSLVGDRKITFYRQTRCGDKLAPTTCKKPRTDPGDKFATAKNSHTDSHEKMTLSEYLQAYFEACTKAQSDSESESEDDLSDTDEQPSLIEDEKITSYRRTRCGDELASLFVACTKAQSDSGNK